MSKIAEAAKDLSADRDLRNELSRGPAHPGWRQASLFVSALEAMGHRKAVEDNKYTFSVEKIVPEQIELWRLCKALFKRSLKGAPVSTSQYGLDYVEFRYGYPPEIVALLGPSKARELLQQQMISELEKLAKTHPVVVWRRWPDIASDGKGMGMSCYMRLHVMTEEQYQFFAQDAD